MPRRHPRPPLPRQWLMTDPRMGDALWRALGRMPRGGGVVFRHYALAVDERRALLRRVERICRARGLLLVVAGGSPGLAGDGRHVALRARRDPSRRGRSSAERDGGAQAEHGGGECPRGAADNGPLEGWRARGGRDMRFPGAVGGDRPARPRRGDTGRPERLAGGGRHVAIRRAAAGTMRTCAAHCRTDIIAARRAGFDAVFVSPAFATRSHPGKRALGRVRFGLMVRAAGVPVIALGGMTAQRARTLAPFGIHGWAAIDAWTGADGVSTRG